MRSKDIICVVRRLVNSIDKFQTASAELSASNR